MDVGRVDDSLEDKVDRYVCRLEFAHSTCGVVCVSYLHSEDSNTSIYLVTLTPPTPTHAYTVNCPHSSCGGNYLRACVCLYLSVSLPFVFLTDCECGCGCLWVRVIKCSESYLDVLLLWADNAETIGRLPQFSGFFCTRALHRALLQKGLENLGSLQRSYFSGFFCTRALQK